MSCYWFNREEILKKAKERYYKEKADECHLQSKKAIKEKSKKWHKNFPEKHKIKEYHRKRYQQLIHYKKEALQNKRSFVFTQYNNEWKGTKIWQY